MKFEKIYIELSDICGLECSFCTGAKNVRGIMNVKDFEKLLPKIQKRAKLYTFHLLGDPLMLNHLNVYINLAKAYDMKLELTTSGFYLSDENINLLLKNDHIHQINISLMAFLSQNKLDLNSYFKPIFQLIQRHIEIKSESFINLRLWNLNTSLKAPSKNNAIYALLQDFFQLKIDTKALKTRLARKVFLNQAKLFKWASLNGAHLRTKGTCHALSKQIGILSDGRVVPCCLDSAGVMSLGNLFTQDLDEILQSPRAVRMKEGFKQGILTEPLCQKCEFYKARTMPE